MAAIQELPKSLVKKKIQTIDFIEDFMRWATKRKDIHAAALVGSYARDTANESSDVDLVIIANDPAKYISSNEWTRVFGKPITKKMEDFGNLISLRVWYESGLEIEFGFTTREWAKTPLDKGTKHVIEGGMKVLFEKEKLLSPHETPTLRSQRDT
ncbi:MAG TPA: hypothetical protein DCX53_08725 [Anaerolineae bacterium]|nr:hypothetical protein [Anaerolineae bacterium]